MFIKISLLKDIIRDLMETNDSEFNRIVDSIKKVEEEADKVKSGAASEADRIKKKGKEDVAKLEEELKDSYVKKKNKILEQGVKEIEEQAQVILEEGKKEASNLKKRSLPKKKFDSLLNSILE